jgi:hypothetical protein
MPRKITESRYLGMSKEEKRIKVLSEGARLQQFVCPLCGLNRVIERKNKGRIRFDNVDLANGLILQERAGGGRDSGFYLDRSKSLTLPELKGVSEYKDLLEQIRGKCEELLEVLK